MFRINYLRPERMPSHQRDFPHRERPTEPIALQGSGELWLMVGGYLLAVLVGILLLGALTPTLPQRSIVATGAVPGK